MEKISAFFKRFGDQITKLWTGLSMSKRIAAAVTLLLIIGGVVALVMGNKTDEREYLFVNVSPEDVQSITAHFKRVSFNDYLIDDRGIKVPSARLAELRLQLAQEGLPAKGQIGWEKFDNRDFTMTEFEQGIHKMRAMQGELSRTIMAIDGVVSARVHIVSPTKSLFIEDQKDPTAAIYVKLKRGGSLEPTRIRAIQHLVSRSVEGLKTENITIVDHEGNMLTKIESQDTAARLTKEMLEYKRNVEKELEQRVRQIVGRIVGPDRVEAKVDATVDFTQEEQTISDVDPEKSAVVSSNRTNYSLQGTGLNPTGIPGSKSNVPGEQETLSSQAPGTSNKHDTELINYESSKTVSKRTLPVGVVKRLSAAVLVDGRQAYASDGAKPQFEARTPEEMKKLESLVRSTIGFKEGRDEVIIQNMMFQLDPYQIEAISEKRKENREYISTLSISAVVALALVFFFAFVVRPYFRWLAYDPERKKKEATIEEFKADLEMQSMQSVQVKEDVPFEKLTPQEQVIYLAKHEPKRTTEALRILLNPHQAAH